MKKLACILAILAMVGTAQAAEHWRGAGWGGDGTTWSQTANWDAVVPWGTSWDVNRTGEQGTPSNHVINVDASGSTTTGHIYAQPGFSTQMTVLSGVTLTTQSLLLDNTAGNVTVQPGAQLNVNAGDAYLDIGSWNTVTVSGGYLGDWLRLLDGHATMNVYGTAQVWGISKWSDDPENVINVYNGGTFALDAGGINWDGNPNRRIGMYVSGRVQRAGDWSTNYMTFVTNLEPGSWEVDYGVTRAGWTTIHLTPEPASLLLLCLGLPLLRRRR